MHISDWSSDVCSSDLAPDAGTLAAEDPFPQGCRCAVRGAGTQAGDRARPGGRPALGRSEEHTSELQSLMRNSYAVFCLKKKNKVPQTTHDAANNVNNASNRGTRQQHEYIQVDSDVITMKV